MDTRGMRGMLPGVRVGEWLVHWLVSVVPKERQEHTYRATDRFTDPQFRRQCETLAGEIDRLVVELADLPDLPDMRQAIEHARAEVVDGLIARVYWRAADLEGKVTAVLLTGRPDIRDALRRWLLPDPAAATAARPTG